MYNSRATKKGHLAQLVEHALDVRRVTGSSPVMSTKKNHPQFWMVLFMHYGQKSHCLSLRVFGLRGLKQNAVSPPLRTVKEG